MGLFGSIFGSDAVIEKGMNGIDAIVYTDQEKARDKIKFLGQFTAFKKAQRVLAFGYSFLFGITFLVGLGISIFNMISEYQQTVAGKDKIVLISLEPLVTLATTFSIGTISIVIITWYFSGGVVDSFKKEK